MNHQEAVAKVMSGLYRVTRPDWVLVDVAVPRLGYLVNAKHLVAGLGHWSVDDTEAIPDDLILRFELGTGFYGFMRYVPGPVELAATDWDIYPSRCVLPGKEGEDERFTPAQLWKELDCF